MSSTPDVSQEELLKGAQRGRRTQLVPMATAARQSKPGPDADS